MWKIKYWEYKIYFRNKEGHEGKVGEQVIVSYTESDCPSIGHCPSVSSSQLNGAIPHVLFGGTLS